MVADRTSEQKFESRGDAALLQSIESALKSGGVEYEKEKRGLDHGVWGELDRVQEIWGIKQDEYDTDG